MAAPQEPMGQQMPMEPVEAPPTAAPAAAEALDAHAKSPGPEIGGHVEAAYHLNLSRPETEDPVVLRSYDFFGGNTFMLHAAHLAIKHSFTDQVSAVIELGGGSDAATNNYTLNAPGNLNSVFDLQEAYATWATPVGLSITAGKFVTYEGIEVIEGPMNPTITRGFLFGLAEPFWHIGAKAHYAIEEIADIGVGVVNGWDQWVDNNDSKTFIFRIGVTPVEEFWAGLSGTVGAERPESNDDVRLSLDLTGGVKAGDMLTINFQANYGQEAGAVTLASGEADDASWFGFGLQPVLTLDEFSLGARFEYFMDNGGSRTATGITEASGDPADLSVWNLTLTPGYTVDEALQIRAEYRLDSASEDIFAEDFSTAEPDAESMQHTIAVAVAYMF
jgi:hypothetical protein